MNHAILTFDVTEDLAVLDSERLVLRVQNFTAGQEADESLALTGPLANAVMEALADIMNFASDYGDTV